jgi:hypothetical protein
MADAGFGIYSIAHTAKNHGHNFVLRLTEVRFNSHKKKATLLDSTSTSRTYDYTWKPSTKERATNPMIPADSVLQVKLYELKIGDQWLYLVTDLTGVWTVYREHIQSKTITNVEQWQEQFKIALDRTSKQKLPNRPGRSFPREAYTRRPKTTHFQKRKCKEKPSETDEEPLK